MNSAPYRLRPALLRFGFLALFLSTFGCQNWQQRGPKGTGLLQKAAASEKNFSLFQPADPYAQMDPGLLSRRVFDAPGPTGTHVEVRDLLVGPAKRTGNVPIAGTLVCEVRSGRGVANVDGQRLNLVTGSVFIIPAGQSFTLENSSNEAIQIRAYVIRAE